MPEPVENLFNMYTHIIKGTAENIKIMGYPFYAENIESDEPYNRREREYTPILNGTEEVTKGKYVHRSFSFSSLISFPPGKPEIYDPIFQKMESDSVEVISRNMGGKFKANITIRKSFPYPNRMKVNVKVTEVPGKKSLIPGESVITVPSTKKIKSKTKVTDKTKTKGSDKKIKTDKNNSKHKKVGKKSKGSK